jgi:Spy/CpxP family protein refolding chaperone
MKTRLLYLFAILLLTTAMAGAQQPPSPTGPSLPRGAAPVAAPQHRGPDGPGHEGMDAFARNFYPPELIMQKQEALQLSEEQLTYFKTEMRRAQLNFTELQWKLQDEAEKLANLAKAQKPDETAILAQLDKVLSAEHDVKRAQLTLLVRIKNKLTPVQQAILNNMREMRTPKPDGE